MAREERSYCCSLTLLMVFQNVIPAEVSLVCVVKPDEFWDKKVTHFCFWKEKDRLGFEVGCCLMTGWFYLFCCFALVYHHHLESPLLPLPNLQSWSCCWEI